MLRTKAMKLVLTLLSAATLLAQGPLRNSAPEPVSADAVAARISGLAEYARRLSPGTPLQIRLLDGKKLEGRLLRASTGSLDLDQTKGGTKAYRLVDYSEVETIQVKSPRQGRPLLALMPSLVYMALQVARAF